MDLTSFENIYDYEYSNYGQFIWKRSFKNKCTFLYQLCMKKHTSFQIKLTKIKLTIIYTTISKTIVKKTVSKRAYFTLMHYSKVYGCLVKTNSRICTGEV